MVGYEWVLRIFMKIYNEYRYNRKLLFFLVLTFDFQIQSITNQIRSSEMDN